MSQPLIKNEYNEFLSKYKKFIYFLKTFYRDKYRKFRHYSRITYNGIPSLECFYKLHGDAILDCPFFFLFTFIKTDEGGDFYFELNDEYKKWLSKQ